MLAQAAGVHLPTNPDPHTLVVYIAADAEMSEGVFLLHTLLPAISHGIECVH
jgi:hypothetical protein